MASLYTKFRLKQNSLSVSDLVAPSWCEVQFDYGLRSGRGLPARQRPSVFTSRTGNAITVRKEVVAANEAVMKRGSVSLLNLHGVPWSYCVWVGQAIHKKLEREIRPVEVTVTTTTQEDRWGLR